MNLVNALIQKLVSLLKVKREICKIALLKVEIGICKIALLIIFSIGFPLILIVNTLEIVLPDSIEKRIRRELIVLPYYNVLIEVAETIAPKFLKTFASKSIGKCICIKIDEEGSGYLRDLKSEWQKSGLTPDIVKRKELMFIVDHYWGRLVSWLRLPRVTSSVIRK